LARPLLAVVAMVIMAVSLAPARGQAPPGADRLCDGGSNKVLRKGKWTTVEKPEALSKITAHAVGGESGKLILVTDGHTVMRSTDRGCSWNTVYTVPTPSVEDTPVVDGLLPEVARMLIPTGSSRAVLVLEGVAKAAGSKVLVSDAAGAEGSFKEATGVPAVTQFREVVAPPDNPDVIYLVTSINDAAGQNDAAGATGPLYVSQDGGKSFRQTGTAGGQIEKLAVEQDTGGRYLWVTRSSGVIQSSQDFGGSFETHTPEPTGEEPDPTQGQVPELPVKWLDVAVFRFATTAHVVVALGAPNRQADVTRAVASYDKGETWQDFPVDGLGPPGGVFFGSSDEQLFATVPTDNTAYRGPGIVEFSFDEFRWIGVDEFSLGSLKDARLAHEPQPGQPSYNAIWMRRDKPDAASPDLLARFEPPPADPGIRRFTGRADCGRTDAGKLPGKRVAFEPRELNVKLDPGEPRTVPLVADVTADPTPSDVFFLVDHSDSMDPALEGLFCSIERLVRDLPERNLDVFFGLGGYNGIDQYTYRRLVNLLPPAEAGPQVSAALKVLYSTAGEDEPLRGALFQTATGAGFNGPGRARPVEPGQQVDWRPDGEKIPRYALVVTDEPYEETTNGEPAFDEVVAALKAKNIRVIGLRVQPYGSEQVTSTAHSPARQLLLLTQLQNFARGTGALAPEGGVDCDGGGTPDIQTGEPIVCTITEQGIKRELDDTLVSIFQSLAGEDVKPLKLVPRKTGGLRSEVQGGEISTNIRKPSRVEGSAVLECTPEQAGRRFEVSYDVVAGAGKVLDSIEGIAQCGEIPVIVPPVVPPKSPQPEPETQANPQPAAKEAPAPAAPEPQPPVVPPAQAPVPQTAVAVAPPPPPPAPAPISSAPAQAAAPAGAQAAAPQGGAAAQQDRQVASKLATVSTDVGGTDEEGVRGQHAMVESHPVAFRPQSPVPVEALYTLGLGISGLFGYVAFAANPRRRRKRGPEPAVVERDRRPRR
jgi:hypothetical protein